jgi:hypothetical protein
LYFSSLSPQSRTAEVLHRMIDGHGFELGSDPAVVYALSAHIEALKPFQDD